MKNLHLVLVLFSIASMFTSFGVYDVDATKNNNGYGKGCENANDNSKVKEKNPHCVDIEPCDEVIWYQDMDGDTFGDPGQSRLINDCTEPVGFVLNSDDCDDTKPDVHNHEACP